MTRLSVVTQYGDGNSQNNSNYTSKRVIIFAIACLTAYQLLGQSTGQQGITETIEVNKMILFRYLAWFLHKKPTLYINYCF